ncbi:hypothetical protein D9M68_157920 [compost metagenome]
MRATLLVAGMARSYRAGSSVWVGRITRQRYPPALRDAGASWDAFPRGSVGMMAIRRALTPCV